MASLSRKERTKKQFKELIKQILSTLALFLVIRWFLFEPFVIPSGSMYPGLWVHDFIYVSKWDTGIKWPVANKWWPIVPKPQAGSVWVFWHKDKSIYMIKRVIGEPGDEISLYGNHVVAINGEPVVAQRDFSQAESDHLRGKQQDSLAWAEVLPNAKATYSVWTDSGDEFPKNTNEQSKVRTRLEAGEVLIWNELSSPQRYSPWLYKDKIIKVVVPEKSYFLMGDHRHKSLDSRFWGFVHIDEMKGPARRIWLSCDELIGKTLCDFRTLRPSRLMKGI